MINEKLKKDEGRAALADIIEDVHNKTHVSPKALSIVIAYISHLESLVQLLPEAFAAGYNASYQCHADWSLPGEGAPDDTIARAWCEYVDTMPLPPKPEGV